MQPARTRMSGVTVAVALLATLTSVAHGGARVPATARPVRRRRRPSPAARLIVPFGAPDGYLFTVRPGRDRHAARRRCHAADARRRHLARRGHRGGPALAARLRRRGQPRRGRPQPPAARPEPPTRCASRSTRSARSACRRPRRRRSRQILIIDTGLDVTHPDIAARARGHDGAREPPGRVRRRRRRRVARHGRRVDHRRRRRRGGRPGRLPGGHDRDVGREHAPAGRAASPAAASTAPSIVAGLDWAIPHHYDIVSMSLGSPDGTYAEYLAVERAIAHGILVVAAAGNEAQSPTATRTRTSTRPRTSTCSASPRPTPTGAWASFSNFLPTNDVSAPGRRRLRRHREGLRHHGRRQATPTCDPLPGLAQPGWCQVDGTSFATPITAAAAAWVWSARRGLTRCSWPTCCAAGARPGQGPGGRVRRAVRLRPARRRRGRCRRRRPRATCSSRTATSRWSPARAASARLQRAILRATPAPRPHHRVGRLREGLRGRLPRRRAARREAAEAGPPAPRRRPPQRRPERLRLLGVDGARRPARHDGDAARAARLLDAARCDQRLAVDQAEARHAPRLRRGVRPGGERLRRHATRSPSSRS